MTHENFDKLPKKIQDEIEKAQKVQININDSQAVADFYDGKLTWEELKNRRQNPIVSKQISEATFNSGPASPAVMAIPNQMITGTLPAEFAALLKVTWPGRR